MYPYLRFAMEMLRVRKAGPLAIHETHVSFHRIWPGDIDPWMELNNGRTLTLYDLGRIPFAVRCGFNRVLREKGWGLTVAGSVVRYRKRLTLFTKIEMQTRLMGWDSKFIYIEQSMWTEDGTCANHGVIRTGIIRDRKLVPTDEVIAALGGTGTTITLPGWARAMFDAEDARDWPPARSA
ncbi:acyl-CoA thioesterase [Pseudooceanicola sediminis]|uniref:Acyl-CoA thioesterase n=1 Tax=Pseudooceanicola sediminis TaxID=2211117 RepID=A0A399J4K1_9RHOB|nr:acyl-CoA thioesterase [Pseudooceanicola sediminis]KAA2315598.1 acyl-CoA thioesterase [Puniceibacterium sp. HSS470]RII40201.1 acyl-CoA thioesterase [Pseudooceanicola sediminis]|tara:strand:+ start:153511 stop:154050 length:540 start_codon:yes stop_codon:yes gene_type:complete